MDRFNIQEIIEKSGKEVLESIIYSKLNESNINKATIHFGNGRHNEDIHFNVNHPNKYSIYYKKSPIGYIRINESNIEDIRLDEVFEKVDLLISRHVTNKVTRFHLGKGQELIGTSDHILSIESFIKRVSKTSHPVLIEGNSGCEKQAIATAIHYNSERSHQNFYELNCSSLKHENFEQSLLALMHKINGGTLFISEIEHLSISQQGKLIQSLSAKTLNSKTHSSTPTAQDRFDIRYIISTSHNLIDEVKESRFLDSLLRQFNYLKIKMPSLKDRRGDIPHILNFLLHENSEGNKVFSEQAISILKNHNWPENYSELEQVGIRLIVLSKGDVITPEDIKMLAPEVFNDDVEEINHKILIENLFNENFFSIKDLHPGLKKSLVYISRNYHKEITLQNLSDYSFVSPSHLSYLFRSNLGRSFKQILTGLRIEKIKKTFKEFPNQKITISSLEVGFGDLSHFEKIFKKHTGMTPREYKNKLKTC